LKVQTQNASKVPPAYGLQTLVANLDMRTVIIILAIFFLTSCGLECVDKKTGLHQASSSIEDAKEKGVFQFELKPNKITFPLDSGRTFEIENAWVEYSWTYQCVDNKAVVTKDDFMHIVIKPKTMPKSLTENRYAITEKGKGIYFGSTHLNFSYKGQDSISLRLVKFKTDLDSSKTYFDKILLTKKVSH
jgi:hypothetical protein